MLTIWLQIIIDDWKALENCSPAFTEICLGQCVRKLCFLLIMPFCDICSRFTKTLEIVNPWTNQIRTMRTWREILPKGWLPVDGSHGFLLWPKAFAPPTPGLITGYHKSTFKCFLSIEMVTEMKRNKMEPSLALACAPSLPPLSLSPSACSHLVLQE